MDVSATGDAQWSKLLAALADPVDGRYPDLRVAVIDSDLGTGGAYETGSCALKQLPDGTISLYGDFGRFQMRGGTSCGVTDTSARYLEYAGGRPLNYSGSIDSVLACLLDGLGCEGCGYEHSLQAFEYALVARGIGNDEQQKMLRPHAPLALIFISDEDDCSAATNDGMFGNKPELRAESASLRCATRAHACSGKNLSEPVPGYPTTGTFTAPLSTCAARVDACSNATDGAGVSSTDTSVPTRCSPLKSVRTIAQAIKSLKRDPNRIVVAGIFGWPTSVEAMQTAEYRIDLVPNPNTHDTANPMVYDLLPACTYVGQENLSGAAPGLRLSAFVDEFGTSGFKFSICEPDFSATMSQIGVGLARAIKHVCLPPSFASFASCSTRYRTTNDDGSSTEVRGSIPACDATGAPPCYTLTPDSTACARGEFLVSVNDPGLAGGSPTLLEFVCQ